MFKNAHNAVVSFARRGGVKIAAGAAVLVAGVQSAHAALPAEATAAFTTITGNVTDTLAAVWPIVALVTGGFVLIKLFKRGANSSV